MEEIEVLEVEVVIDAVVIVTGNAVAEAPWPASVCVGKLCRSNKRNYVSTGGICVVVTNSRRRVHELSGSDELVEHGYGRGIYHTMHQLLH